MKYHSLPLFLPSWVNIALGFPCFSAIVVLEGRGEEHTGLKAEMGSHLSYSEMLAFFLLPSPFPFLREMSPVREARIGPGWPKKVTRLSRTNVDLLTFFHLPP